MAERASGVLPRMISAAHAAQLPVISAPVPLGPTSTAADLWVGYQDIVDRHDRLLTLVQTKDWGFANSERIEQLERAVTMIARILTTTDMSRAEQAAQDILNIIALAMPDLFPSSP